ncbi:hypothetical protein [Gelidibacter sp. F63206]|uniref:hypothetical protein n=1 Tax=Gelidibacter sp. F63206 TaxID=2926425 RepID=UPI001FF17BF8|nr:hypothetical protein [Gelidibacter sp. F63206]MCK0114790.1 hypothetical protein [Gelidibacter sp. F63206]
MLTFPQKIDVFLDAYIIYTIMVISHFTLKYKVMVYSVFGLSILLSLLLFFLSSPDSIHPELWNDPQSILTSLFAAAILLFGCFPLLKMETIRIESERIIFQKYVFTSNIKEMPFKYYDYYNIIYEESENGEYEAVWLIKNGKLAKSFSSYEYFNFKDLKEALNIENKGPLDLSPIKQLRCKLGAKI